MSKRTRRQRLQKQRSSERNRGVESVRRLLRAEPLEDRVLLAADLGVDFNNWHNYVRATDVNHDGVTSPVDALVVINELNTRGPRNLALSDGGSPEGETTGRHFLDTNGDNHLTAADALGVIDVLNGEGEPGDKVEFRISLTDTNDQALPQNQSGQDQVLLGDKYRMRVETRDIHIPPTAVFTAYLDVDFNDNSLFDVVVGETQRLTFSPVATAATPASTFTLTFNGQETAPISIAVVDTGGSGLPQDLVLWPEIHGEIQLALEALPNIDAGDVVVEHAPIKNLSDPASDNPSIFTIRWQGQYIATDVSELSVNVSNMHASNGSTVTGTIDELYPADSANVGAFRSSMTMGANYQDVVTGALLSDSFDDVGACYCGSSSLGQDWFDVLSLDMVATSAGLATYQAAPAVETTDPSYPDGTGNAVLLLGSQTPIPVTLIEYGTAVSVNIIKPVDAQDDSITMDEDAGLTNVDVMVNDVLNIEGTLAVESVSAGSAGGTVAIAGDALSINYTAADDFNGTETFTYVLTNGAGTTDTGTVTVTVNPINDTPANVVAGSQSINEDSTLTFNAANSNQLSVSDIDADPAGVQTIVSVTDGTLALTTGGGATISNNGSDTVTVSGTTTQVNAALDGLTYSPTLNFNGNDTLTVNTSDLGNTGAGGTLVDTDTVAISVAALNDSPENTVPGNQVLLNMPGAIDNLNLTGATAISVTDVDADPAGVLVTLSLDNAGTLTVVNPGNATVGNNGTGGVTVSGTTAEVNGALGEVRYSVDDDNFWDETVILTVATSDLGNTGSGGTKVDTDTVSIYVAPPSQPYAIDDVGNTTEDPVAALAVDVLANDLLGPNAAALAITEINGAAVVVGATAATANGGTVKNNGTSLEYTPAAEFYGDDTFTYTIASSPDAGDGPSTGNVTISVAAVNDGPVNVVPGSQLLNNLPGVNDELVFSSANGNAITVSDVDAAEVQVTLSLDKTGSLTLPTTTGLQVSGNGSSSIVATGSPADINTALDGLTYTVADDNFYPETVTLTVATSDLGNTGSGGTLGDTDTVQITVDPPARPYAVDDTGSTTEDPSGPLVLSDVLTNDFVPAGSTAAITEINGAVVSVGATVATANGGTVKNNGTSLEYTPAADYNGDDTFTYTIASTPDAGDGPSTGNVTVSVTAVNDVPSFTAGSNVTSLEDAGTVVESGWATGLSAGPADESSQTLSFQVVGNDNPGLFAAPPVVNGANGDLSFTASPDANGSAVITLLLKDDGGTEQGGVDTSASQQFTITVGDVNDAPSFTGGADLTVLEDAGAQTSVDWATNLSKGPSDESTQTLSFQVTGNSNPGLFASGPAISETGTLSFTPAADANGSATVDIVLKDDGGTADGGSDTSTAYSFDINVTAVNDAPVFTAGSDPTSDEDAGAQTVNGWATGISAGPADESSQVLSFAVTGNTNPGLFASGPTVDAAGNLSYETAADANGSATITVALSDDGGTANAGADTSAGQQFTIIASAVNDAPVISLPTDPVLITDYDNIFSTANGNAFQMSDVDAGSGVVIFQFGVTRAVGLDVGTLTVNDTSGLTNHTGNGTDDVTLTGTVAAVNAALGSGVNYQTVDATPTGTTNDFVLTVDVSDQGHTGSGGAMQPQATMTGQVFDFIPSTIGGTIYIDADNDGQHTPDAVSLAGVQMVLTGTDFQNATVNETVVSDENGYYEFSNLKPTQSGTSYTVTQVQPGNLIDGQESLEAPLVAAGNDTATVAIGIQGGVNSVNNNFGEWGLEPWCVSVLDLLASSQDKPGILHSTSTGSVWTALLGSAWDGYTNLSYTAAADGLSAQVTAKYNGQDVSSTVTWDSQARMSMRQDDSGGYVIRVYGTPADLGLAAVEGEFGGEGEASREQFEQDVDAVLADGSWA